MAYITPRHDMTSNDIYFLLEYRCLSSSIEVKNEDLTKMVVHRFN